MATNLTGTLEERVHGALSVAHTFGGVHGVRQKQWVIDQMVQALTGDGYEEWVDKYNESPDGPDAYIWDGGVSP